MSSQYGSDDDLKTILRFFWPAYPVYTLNQELRRVACTGVSEFIKCSKLMDMVPRPPGGAPGLTYLMKQAIGIIIRMLKAKQNLYETCRKGVAYRWRIDFDAARMGV